MFGFRSKRLEKRIERLEFIHKNPPKYIVGDKPDKDHIIIYSEAEEYITCGMDGPIPCGFKWIYKATNIKTGLQKSF